MLGYYIICTESYEIDGIKCNKGDMDYYASTQPLFAKKWRRATEQEINDHKIKLGLIKG